jgi:hypothetical protein
MATIKTQLVSGQRRIITKDGKVSCSCCEEPECCMYPADQLGAGYTIDDLPDKIKFVGGEFTKNNPPLVFTNDPNVLIYYGVAGEGVGIAGGEEVWRQFVDFGGTGGARCLIGDIGGSSFTDDFADTYTVTVGSTTGTVTRESLCVWRGLTTDGCPIALSYDRGIEEIEIDAAALKWAIRIIFFDPDFGCSGSGSIFIKAVQNSPAGSDYIDNNIFSNATASVS